MQRSVNKTSTLLITASGSFLTPFMGSSVTIALPSIGRELAMDAILLSWISTGYLLTVAMFLVPVGRVADIYGRKKIYSLGILVFFLCAGGIFSSLATGKMRKKGTFAIDPIFPKCPFREVAQGRLTWDRIYPSWKNRSKINPVLSGRFLSNDLEKWT